jgi:hypothetical protein
MTSCAYFLSRALRSGSQAFLYPLAPLEPPAFLICVEQGRLETEAILLVESLRAWGGACANAPVYAFAPRVDQQPSPETVERLESMGTTVVTEALVGRFADNPTYNKVTVSAWAERELDHKTLVFTDTDSVFLGEPAELADGDWDAAMRPVDRRIAGSRGKGKNEPYWRRMYEALGVEAEPYVETGVGRTRIRAYWNSGLLAARRSAGLFGAWERALIHLHDADLVFEKWPHFMDQLTWAAVTADHHDRVRILSYPYNYPMRHRGSLEPEANTLDLDELVHLHYRLWFHMPDSLPKVYPPFEPDSERFRWLAERLPLHPIVEEPY